MESYNKYYVCLLIQILITCFVCMCIIHSVLYCYFIFQVGPANPFKTQQQIAHKNSLAGFVEPAHIDHFQFENQRRTFHTFG